ncbi:hypothetical protein [Mucilaginibacter sp.]
MNVEQLWIAGHHVNWETGEPDMPESKQGIKTHCSAFAAAACERLNIYILRPPQHGQVLLANAQYNWLNSYSSINQGWQKLTDNGNLFIKAQQLADDGKVVVAVCKNTIYSKPGHIALVMPSDRSETTLINEGPCIIMAGTHNFNYISLIKAFKSHITSWPSHEIDFFVHDVPTQVN